MKTFFDPASVAVIGASDRANSLGAQMIVNLLYGYEGQIYPVNPNYDEIGGIRCYPSVEAIPDPVDLAIIIVPAPVVPGALEACGRKGIYRVMIQSAGFSEVGREGKTLQGRCTDIAKATGIRVWGPNCMGLVDVPRKHLFTFMHPKVYEDGLIPGRISLIVQSGMLSAGFLTDLMSERSIGVGKACSIGNKSDVDECDILEYLLDDDETDAVAMYLESIPRGRRFVELASAATKPIVVLKGGRSSAGARAAMSHTSSLAGDSRLQDSLFRMAGVTIAHDFQQMMELTRALAVIPHTPPACRTAILTFSGGAGILSCDLIAEQGLSVAEFSPETKQALDEIFPDWLPAANPVDLFPVFGIHGPLAAYHKTFDVLVEDPKVDAILLHYFAGLYKNYEGLARMKEQADQAGKILIAWVIGRRDATKEFRIEAQKSGIPVHGELARAVECLAAASRYEPRKNTAVTGSAGAPARLNQDVTDFVTALNNGRVWDEYDSKRLLYSSHIPVVDERVIQSLSEAETAAGEMGYPVVLKGLIPGSINKTEAGLVHLDITSPATLKDAFETIRGKMNGQGRVVVQRQMKADYELIGGFLRNDQFGPCVMFGLGGVFSELEKDVVFAPAPLSRETALKLIGRIRGHKLLRGFRGMAPLREELMADVLVSLGNLGAACDRIEQIDINPLAVADGVPTAVDATVIVNEQKQ